MKPNRVVVLIGAAVFAVALLAAACGDDDEEGIPAPAAETPAAGGELGPQPEPPQALADEVTEPSVGVIETEMGDNFFTKNNLKVALGETVTIRATNTGQAIHNFRIAGVDGEWNTEDDIVSDPDAVRSEEVGELEFRPQIPGSYTFRCDFHPTEQGGVIVVES